MNIFQKSQTALEFDKVLLNLTNYAKTEQSALMCKELTPYNMIKDIEEELKLTREAKFILDNALDIPIDYIQDFKKLKCKNGYFKEEELVDIANTLRTFRLISNFLKEHISYDSSLSKITNCIYTNKILEDKIFNTFDNNLIVKRDATPEIAGLYSSLKDTDNILKQKVQELITSIEFQAHLQDNIYTIRDERIVFQVKASNKSKVPGIVHDVSATNRTFYIEPAQIIPLNNKIRELKSKIYAEVIRILTALSKEIKKDIDELIKTEKLIAKIDLTFAKARYAIATNSVEPEINKEKIIKIDLMRHPLLINIVDTIVENDFYIGKEYNSIIITGSNTGGKTVALKTVGLFILMMKSGMFLPCAGASIYPYENILADIGDEQSIQQSLSTFSSHIKNIIKILQVSNSESFVLIDELCAGTDPQEGAVLAEVILKSLAKKNVTSIITTHYGELKTLEYIDSYFKNASVEFNTETLSPTYKLIIGIPGLSNAITISANLGLDEELIWNAKELLITHKDKTNIAIERLQNTQHILDINLKEAAEQNNEAETLKKYYENEIAKHKKEKKKSLKILKDKFEAEINNAKSEIKNILNELRKEKSEKIARRSYSKLANIEQKFRNTLSEENVSDVYEDIQWKNIKLNDTLMLKELNQKVKLLSLPDKNDQVYIQMGMIKTKVTKDRLAIYNQELAKQIKLPLQNHKNFSLKKYDISNKLDVRGLRVEEALDDLEAYLDKASLVNLSPVYIIHGHGTGALKSSIRNFVSTSPYVAKYRIGENAEGGDGVTVIDIK